jgi:hypothetical protein
MHAAKAFLAATLQRLLAMPSPLPLITKQRIENPSHK